MSAKHAIGVIRVSQVGKRKDEPDRFASPDEQRARLVSTCATEGITLDAVFEELDMKGGTPLANRTRHGRPGLREALDGLSRPERVDWRTVLVATRGVWQDAFDRRPVGRSLFVAA